MIPNYRRDKEDDRTTNMMYTEQFNYTTRHSFKGDLRGHRPSLLKSEWRKILKKGYSIGIVKSSKIKSRYAGGIQVIIIYILA